VCVCVCVCVLRCLGNAAGTSPEAQKPRKAQAAPKAEKSGSSMLKAEKSGSSMLKAEKSGSTGFTKASTSITGRRVAHMTSHLKAGVKTLGQLLREQRVSNVHNQTVTGVPKVRPTAPRRGRGWFRHRLQCKASLRSAETRGL
jgi:hypothetical protein